ncbi:MAG: helix-turn-helix transcriptional regulator, partial [Parvularculaceae bacterium]
MRNVRSASELLEKLGGPLTFGRFVLSLRTLYGYSQTTLAKKLHISLSLIKDMEEDRILPSSTLIKKIVKLGGFPEEFVQKLVPNSKRKTKISTSAKCIFSEIGHSESEVFSLRFRSHLISNLSETL